MAHNLNKHITSINDLKLNLILIFQMVYLVPAHANDFATYPGPTEAGHVTYHRQPTLYMPPDLGVLSFQQKEG